MKKTIKGFRKRVLVNEMELFNLYREVEEIRNREYREKYRKGFRALLKEAEYVNFEVEPKKKGDGHVS